MSDTHTSFPDVDERFAAYRRTRDRAVRNELIETYAPLARRLARRFEHRGEPLEDLTQVAMFGLLKAVERFDPDQGVAFTSFATPTVLGEMRRHFRDKGWAVRVPRRLQELHLAVNGAVRDLSQELGRSPKVSEIAQRTNASVEEVLEAMDAGQAYRTTSIEALTGPDSETTTPDHLASFGEEDLRLGNVEDRLTVETLLAQLGERERQIFRLRFESNLTQSQIAEEIGISQMHVSRLLSAGLARLRSHLTATS